MGGVKHFYSKTLDIFMNSNFHLAVRVSSVNNLQAPFTAPGLGDRIHLLTVAWAYANAHSCIVTLNLSSHCFSRDKQRSFLEILELFPAGKIKLNFHNYTGVDELKWHEYLGGKGIDAKTFFYGDHLGRFEKKTGFDVTPYLQSFPKLNNLIITKPNLVLPDKFITMQWDASGSSRTLNLDLQSHISRQYLEAGFQPLILGGKSTNFSKNFPLANAAYAMSKAELHVGVDSGFMHLAFLYMDFSKVHIYANSRGYWSHHLFRAYENGCVQNLMCNKPSCIQRIRIKALYNSQIMNKVLFSRPVLVDFIKKYFKIFKIINASQ
jgi:hypothetical protein